MKAKIKSKEFLGLLAGGTVVLIIASVLGYKSLIQKVVQQKQTSTSPTNIQVNQNETEQAYNFDEKTRVLTSPTLEGSERNDFGRFKFQLVIPSGWKVDKSTLYGEGISYMLSLTKDGKYYLDINYGSAYGPNTCIFSGDTSTGTQGGELIKSYTSLNTGIGNIRIFPDLYESYTVFRTCQTNKWGEWSTSTKLDLLIIRAPRDYDKNIIKEAENTLKSIKTIAL